MHTVLDDNRLPPEKLDDPEKTRRSTGKREEGN
jgi:hypothetical protein